MMKPNISRRGSALLIVLGMLSFMVVSAVAFSILMRQGRLPSSFLRQKLISRQIVKAGLAQAMSELDKAINDNPYPGNGDVEYDDSDNNRVYRNYWRNRVYLGYDDDSQSGFSNTDGYPEAAVPEKTVSTFPLEGLAYIPAPLVNTVRYWARRSNAAKWKPLDYDSGRYAFTAVNVSDYLDINRVHANVMRDSSPSNRISIAYLFEEPEKHEDWGDVKPDKFDEFLDTKIQRETYGRLVSLADYNLAIGKDDIGFKSPFYEFIMNPSGDGSFLGSVSESEAKIQKFVTDSWYPGSETNTAAMYLTDDDVQPFYNMEEGLDPLMKAGSKGFNEMKQHLNLCERAAFRDYIDEDNVPTSLALPTLERVPSLVGLQVTPFRFAPTIIKEEDVTEDIAATETEPAGKVYHKLWTLTGLGDDPKLIVGGSLVFPFKRTSGITTPDSFPVQILARMFLVPADQDFTVTRVSGTDARKTVYRPVAADWKSDPSLIAQLGANDRAIGTLYAETTATVKPGTTENDALIDFAPVPISAALGNDFRRHVYGISYRQREGKEPENISYDVSRMENPLPYRLLDGSPSSVKGNASLELKVVFAVYVRVIGADGKTVDMFPATIKDDKEYNSITLPGVRTDELGEQQTEPIVPVTGPVVLTLNDSVFTPNTGDLTVTPNPPTTPSLSIYCNDPRFNWAPEDWFSAGDGTAISASDWFNRTKVTRDGSNGRQSDLFQFVSNQGYLQSMGEFQFLPLVRDDYADFRLNSPIEGHYFRDPSTRYNGAPFSARTSPDDIVDKDFVWKTRWSFGEYADWEKGGDVEDPYQWNIYACRGGAAVNPYADEELFMAALANTPYDYIVASENDEDSSFKNKKNKQNNLETGLDFCFNASSPEAKIEWKHLLAIGQKIKQHFAAGDPWEEWDDWKKSANDTTFFDQPIENIHDVDRKFLFSYWKECFANNQQLFLVFVRAEPTVMGNSGSGHTPAQLGARAVALVWRDPVGSLPPQGTGTKPSHRMRILFYHQFD